MRIDYLPVGYIPKHCSNSPRSSWVQFMEDRAVISANHGVTPRLIGQRHFPGAYDAIREQSDLWLASMTILRMKAVDSLGVTA